MWNDVSGLSALELRFPKRLATITHVGYHIALSIGHFENLGARNPLRARNPCVAQLDEFYISFYGPFSSLKKCGGINRADANVQLYQHVLWIDDRYGGVTCLNVFWDRQGEANVAYFRDFSDPLARGWDRRLRRHAEREFRAPTTTFLLNSSFPFPPRVCV
jgi:hypothetical protein